MFCKIYYTRSYGHTQSECFDNFIGCNLTEDGKGITFTYGEISEPKSAIRRVPDIEDIKIFATNPLIF